MLGQSGLLFMPRRWQRATILRWLKRTHAWTGLWGALLFLLMGTSGFFLNHRAQLKIGTGDPVAQQVMNVAVKPEQFTNADALGRWAKATLALPVEGRAPPSDKNGGRPRSIMGTPLPEAQTWMRIFTLANAKVTISHVPGSPSVRIETESLGLLATIKNLHKGTGLGIVWVLFLDTIAGALIVMSLTGFLLWTRLHGSRLLAGGLAGGSLTLALLATVPNLL
jgi:uncharacterized protein